MAGFCSNSAMVVGRLRPSCLWPFVSSLCLLAAAAAAVAAAAFECHCCCCSSSSSSSKMASLFRGGRSPYPRDLLKSWRRVRIDENSTKRKCPFVSPHLDVSPCPCSRSRLFPPLSLYVSIAVSPSWCLLTSPLSFCLSLSRPLRQSLYAI